MQDLFFKIVQQSYPRFPDHIFCRSKSVRITRFINEIVHEIVQEKEREIDEDLETASDQLQRSFTTEEAMLRRVPDKSFKSCQ